MNGSEALAAAHAGIHIETFRRQRRTDAHFDAECDAAFTFHKQLVEWESHSVGRTTKNPLPFFAKLKKLDPTGYVERLVTVNASVTPEMAPEGLDDLLAKLVEMSTQANRDLMVRKFGTIRISEALGEDAYRALVEAGKLPPLLALGEGPGIIDAEPA